MPFFGFGVLGVFQFQEIFDWLTYITRCVDLRTGAFDVPPQEILTRDSVTVSVDAVVYYQVYLGTLHSHQGLSYHLIYIFWVSEVPPPACGAEVLVFVRASNHQYYEVWRHVFELFVLLSPSVCSVLLRSSNHCQSNIWVWELISQDYNFFRKGLVQIRLWLHDHQIKRTILFVCGIDMILFLCTWGLHWIIKQPNWTQHRSSPTK